jgi:diadenosine tetraphosphate (Ap4A) HIT family hydrolase
MSNYSKISHRDKMTDLEQAQKNKVAPWENVFREESSYVVFKDAYPVTHGHLLFVPKWNTTACIMDCFESAVELGGFLKASGDCDGYNVGINQGLAAGQTVMYPHVHFIPRRSGDTEDPTGGVRGVIPRQQNYRSNLYKVPE